VLDVTYSLRAQEILFLVITSFWDVISAEESFVFALFIILSL